MRIARLTGVCALLGGLCWVAACLVHNSLPQGCIDTGCDDGRLMRGSSPADGYLFGVSGVLLGATALGLLLLARRRRPPGAVDTAAAITGAVGLLLLLAAGIISTFVDNNWGDMPALVLPGIVLLAAGLVLVGWVVLRSGTLPPWLSAALLLTAALLPLANEQTSRILLAVPFGLALAVAGVDLLVSAPSEGRRSPAAPPPRQDPTAG